MSVLTVVDLGCHTHAGYPEDESVEKLIGRFAPVRLLGFDPHPDLVEQEGVRHGGTLVWTRRLAAWVRGGEITYDVSAGRPLAANVGRGGPAMVPCFDLALALRLYHVTDGARPVVKMDVEGAEYPLLEHLHETQTDALVALLLVEWHHPPIGPPHWETRRDALLARLRCPVEAWD